MRPVDLTGARFGKLQVTALAGSILGVRYWSCICDCGGTAVIRYGNLHSGNSESCGCMKGGNGGPIKHGEAGHGRLTPEYISWRGAVQRCTDPKTRSYADYGGRGIQICARWRNSYENFLADMGRRPSRDHSIDRIDTNGNYEPGNCRWATRSEQQRNKRCNTKNRSISQH